MAVPAEVLLTPERWDKALAVLSGEDGSGISKRAAAAAAGVSVRVLESWVSRSRERNIEDEDWIHDIAPAFDGAGLKQAQALEDRLWSHAMGGVGKKSVRKEVVDGELTGNEVVTLTETEDPKLAMELLAARDPRYRKDKGGNVNITFNREVLFQKFGAVAKIVRARQLKEDGVIEIQGSALEVEAEKDEWTD